MSHKWTRLDDKRPVMRVIVSRVDDETGRYLPPVMAQLKRVWVTEGGTEYWVNDDDQWMNLPPLPDPIDDPPEAA